MRIERTRDILDHARKFHRMIADAYHQKGEHADHIRLRMLLDYLELHEKHLEKTLGEYEEAASKKILEHWFRQSPCEVKFAELNQLLAQENPTEDDIVNLAVSVDNCMIDLYKSFVNYTDDENVRALFQDLVSLEEHEQRRMVRDSLRFQDL